MSRPGNSAPKSPSSREPTQSPPVEGHGSDQNPVDKGRLLSPGSKRSACSEKPSLRESGDLEGASPGQPASPHGKAMSNNPWGQTFEESDEVIVPKKPTKTRVTPVESAEGRTEAKGKSAARNASQAQDRTNDASTVMQRIGQRAKEKPKEKFTNLLSHMKRPLLKEAYERVRKRAAPGVDGVTWEEYGERLSERLHDLQERVHKGSYHPQPVRRVHIPKGDGGTRPLGIPALEDKIVQQAARMILEPIYEAMFIGFSYGYRPGKSAHEALDAVAAAIERKVNWVLDADIRSFFDTINHGWMQKFLEHRIGDKRMVRLLMKWMKAGVMEDGELREVHEGTPQGGLISPLLANIYLHYALDLWVRQWRHRHAYGEVYFVRYADDFIVGLQEEQDAHAIREAIAERLAKFGLELHPEKTRVIQFGRFALKDQARYGLSKPDTFEFLGLTHIASVDRRGKFQLKRRTSRKKRNAKLAKLKEECERRRHVKVSEQHAWLSSVLLGHYRYYGVPTNYDALKQVRRAVTRTWHRSLQRRSQRAKWTAADVRTFEQHFSLPLPRIFHPWPTIRFDSR
jgi:RNA-directed DNA polymerase